MTCVVAAEPAEADRAAELDQRARDAFSRKRFREAAELFERANRHAPFPATQFNAALAWERAGDLARAADAYELALSLDGLDADRTNVARDRLAALKKNLGTLSVTAPLGASVSVAHVVRAPIPTRIHVRPGSHDVMIRDSAGRERKTQVRVFAGETAQVVVALPDAQPARDVRAAPAERPTPRADAIPNEGSTQRTFGYVALGGGVVLGITAAFLGMRTLDALDDYKQSDRRDLDARDRTLRYKTWTNVALAGAVVAGALGLYLVLDAPSGHAGQSKIGIHVGYDRQPSVAAELSF